MWNRFPPLNSKVKGEIYMYTYFEVIAGSHGQMYYANLKCHNGYLIISSTSKFNCSIKLSDIIYVTQSDFLGTKVYSFNYQGTQMKFFENGLGIGEYLRNQFKDVLVKL